MIRSGFWDALEKPILALAPMYDVTDAPFRQMMAKIGRPGVMFTEFVNIDGLLHPASGEKLRVRHLRFEDVERPLVAQIWGRDPEKFRQAGRLIAELGFDGVDINMGCPDKAVMKQKTCAALILDPQRAQDIIRATLEGAGGMPVSVKTRLGVDTNIIERWLPSLLEAGPAVVSIHGRTAKEMSKVPAHWDAIRLAAGMAKGSGTLIIGNGDVRTHEDALRKAQDHGLDGVMIGRGVFANLSVFKGEEFSSMPVRERCLLLSEHIRLFDRYFRDIKNFALMRKHFQNYLRGTSEAHELQKTLMQAPGVAEAIDSIKKFLRETLI